MSLSRGSAVAQCCGYRESAPRHPPEMGRSVGGLPLLHQVALGDHVCWTIDDDAIRMEAIAAFVRAGLLARHKVIYSGDEPETVLEGLERHGVGTQAALAEGLLRAVTAESSYL